MSLTREQVLAMTTGDELDIQVSTLVMGFEIRKIDRDEHSYDEFFFRDGIKYENVNYRDEWQPSRFIDKAWEVEEKLLLKHPGVQTRYVWRLRLVTGWEDKQPSFREDFKLIHATPEQRCKAALLAVLNL